MKTKIAVILSLSALLLAPLVSQAEWIETTYWPYIYRHNGNTWEYAYTNCFWTWSYSTGEYSFWGQAPSALAPASLEGMELIWLGEAFVMNLYGDTPYLYDYEGRGTVWLILNFTYEVIAPDTAHLLAIIKFEDYQAMGTVHLTLQFQTPTEGNCIWTTVFEPAHPGQNRTWKFDTNFVLSEGMLN